MHSDNKIHRILHRENPGIQCIGDVQLQAELNAKIDTLTVENIMATEHTSMGNSLEKVVHEVTGGGGGDGDGDGGWGMGDGVVVE